MLSLFLAILIFVGVSSSYISFLCKKKILSLEGKDCIYPNREVQSVEDICIQDSARQDILEETNLEETILDKTALDNF